MCKFEDTTETLSTSHSPYHVYVCKTLKVRFVHFVVIIPIMYGQV